MVRVLLTVLASVWIRIGGQFGAVALRGLSAPEGRAYLDTLALTVDAMIRGELRPRWETWRDRVLPPESGTDLFGALGDGVPNLAWFARSVLIVPLGGGAAPPWEAMWGDTAIPSDGVDAAELHRVFNDPVPDNAARAAAYRTLRDQHRNGWRVDIDAVLLDPDTALPAVASDLSDRIASHRETRRGPMGVRDPWVSIRAAAARRLNIPSVMITNGGHV